MLPIISLRYLPLVFSGIGWILLFGVGFYLGSDSTEKRNIIEQQEIQIAYQEKINALTNQVRSQEIQTQSKINSIISEQMIKEDSIRDEYEKTIEELRNGISVLSDVTSVYQSTPATSSSTVSCVADTSNLVCYTKGEFYRKLEKSLALATECDALANRYNTLLATCKEFTPQFSHTNSVHNTEHTTQHATQHTKE